MEFGKLVDISSVNWELPKPDPRNKEYQKQHALESIYIGSPAWSVKSWCGKIYPKDCATEEYLKYYSKHFQCIELNTTHYRIPDLMTILKWREKVNKNFKFCPKVFKEISHSPMGLSDRELLSQWTKFIGLMDQNLGPCFIQFHENFSYADKRLLFNFLESWPSEYKLSLELRHSSWYQNNTVLPALADYLHKKNIGLVITDVAGKRAIVHETLTAPWAMIRLIGNDLDSSDEKRIRSWAQRFKEWRDQGPSELYLFYHQPEDNLTLEFAQLGKQVFDECYIDGHPKFDFIQEKDLFDFTN